MLQGGSTGNKVLPFSFGELVPLDWKCHTCISVVYPEVRQDGYKGMELGTSLPPLGRKGCQWGSDKIQAGYVLLKYISPLLRKTECSVLFQDGFFASLPAQSIRDFFFFSEIHCENFVDIHEVKLKEWETLWWLGSSGVFNNQNCPHWASRNLAIQLDFPSWTVLPTKIALVSCNSPYSPVGVSSFECSNLPVTSLLWQI